MGANISMETRAAIVEDSSSSSSPLLLPMLTPTPTLHAPKSFEDKLRTESVLIPEDMTDIHIEAPANDAADTTTTTTTTTTITDDTAPPTTDTPADNTRYGKGKHWKRNMKKKQQPAVATTASTERTIEQRREQVRPIIDKLTELQMNISYPAIRELYKQLNHFVKTGEDTKIKISFPEFSRKIKGELSNATYKHCWVKLEME